MIKKVKCKKVRSITPWATLGELGLILLLAGCATNADLGAFLDNLNIGGEYTAIHPMPMRATTCVVVEYSADGVAFDSRVQCVGANDDYEMSAAHSSGGTTYPVDVEFSNAVSFDSVDIISGRFDHVCAVRYGGEIWCWGVNSYKQAGQSSGSHVSYPTYTGSTITDFSNYSKKSLATGSDHTCFLDGNQVYCWGLRTNGQLGDGTISAGSSTETAQSVTNSTPATLTGIKEISAGRNHTCALKDDDTAWCWGRNHRGQLGNNTTGDVARAVQVQKNTGGNLTGVQSISVGGDHSCAIVNDANSGEVWCWGSNQFGQFAIDPTISQNQPSACTPGPKACGETAYRVGTHINVSEVAAGDNYTCMILQDSSMECVGKTQDMVLGVDPLAGGLNNCDGTANDCSYNLLAIKDYTDSTIYGFSQVELGKDHGCASIGEDVHCWGSSLQGQIGASGVHYENPTALPWNQFDL